MKLLFVTTHLFPDYHFGGVAQASHHLLSSLTSLLPQTAAFCVSKNPAAVTRNYPDNVTCAKSALLHRWGFAPKASSYLKPLMKNADIVIVNGIMSYPTTIAARLCLKLNKPYVVAVHGGLMPYKLKEKKRRKVLFDHIIKPILDNAAATQAICQAESENLKKLKVRSPITIIPNGVNIPAHTNDKHNLPPEIENKIKNKRIALFVGRLSPIKGLDLLIPAWAQVVKQPQFENCLLILAGPDENGYLKKIKNIIADNHLENKILLTGLVTGQTKIAIIKRAEIFIQPSYSEGLSMSILEALAAEKPVIITTGCNFPQISKARAGTCVPPKTDNLKNAITEMLSKPPDQLAAIGKNGKKFVADNYTWQIAAKKYITLLNNIINNENIPHQNQLNNTIP